MAFHVRPHGFGKRLSGSRQLLKDQQEGNHSVVGVEVLTKVVVRAHLAGEDAFSLRMRSLMKA